MADYGIDPLAIDVGRLVRNNVAPLYSSLVTRPTGQAVRMAIENALAEEKGPLSLSFIDLSEVTVLDFSCADEVVAKLLLLFQGSNRPRETFFVFRGIREPHRDPVEAVLHRHGLVAVADAGGGALELLGSFTEEEGRVWRMLEERGRITAHEAKLLLPGGRGTAVLEGLARRRVAFRSPRSGDYRALSSLLRDLV